MAQGHPTWLDACYVQKILRNAEKDESIEVSGITVKAATAKGDNYGSDMYRVAVEFSRAQDGRTIQEKKSLIAKVAPQGDMREEMIEAEGIFETELSIMSITLPRMDEILEKLGSTSLGARCLHVQYEKPSHAVIEDLVPKGFRMAERQAGLDLDHCLLAIRNLGKFHAASIALKEKDPNVFTNYTKGMLHKDQPAMVIKFFNSAAKSFSDETAEWPELSPRIKEKIQKLSKYIYTKGCEATRYKQDDFNVLNHGDFWVNNMLFRYDEQGKPIDHIFVDFQISHYGSAANDLLYFLGTSPTDEVRRDHRELILQEYYTSLTSTMAKLKCNTEILSFDNLQEILKNRAFAEVVATVAVLPIVALEKGEVLDFDEMARKDGDYTNPGYNGKSYRKIMTRLLPWYDSMGLLDM